jgi:hypothetical protein
MTMISLDGKPRKVRNWYKSHVYCWYRFRMLWEILWEQNRKASNHVEKKRVEQKMKHLQKKVNEYMKTGELLGLTEEEMKSFNLAIIREIKNGKNPKEIIQILLKNGQK